VAGYVFICLAARRDSSTRLSQLPRPALSLDERAVAFESTIVEEGQWKLVWKTIATTIAPAIIRSWLHLPRTPTTTGVSGALTMR
jgi:hypothetical protein